MEEIIIAGFGGQGILLLGKLIAEAGLLLNKEVSWIPSYGPEMRGGTANCHVIISEESIGSPVVASPNVLLVLNKPSLAKYEPKVKSGGLMILNSSLVDVAPSRGDLRSVLLPATDMADRLGNTKLTNLVMMGAFLALSDCIDLPSVEASLRKTVGKKRPELLELNLQALNEGMRFVRGKEKEAC